MKAAQITAYGGLDVLTIREVPRPQPGPGEALVAVVATTINPVDMKTRQPGTPQQVPVLPATLGWDVAGIVLTAPPDTDWRPGDRVVTMWPPTMPGGGSWAEQVALPANLLAAAPGTTDLPAAATLPLAGLTAQQALARLGPRRGETLLVTGAAGAVGGFAVQLAASDGLQVTGLVHRPGQVQAARDLGAAVATANPDELDPSDLICDTAGVLDPRLLATGGRFVTVAVPDEDIPTAIQAKATLAVTNYVHHDPTGLATLVRLVDNHQLTLRVARRYPLTRISLAHQHAENGGLNGKTVLTT